MFINCSFPSGLKTTCFYFSIVEKWVKLHKMDFLGIPSCVGFGIYEASRYVDMISCRHKIA